MTALDDPESGPLADYPLNGSGSLLPPKARSLNGTPSGAGIEPSGDEPLVAEDIRRVDQEIARLNQAFGSAGGPEEPRTGRGEDQLASWLADALPARTAAPAPAVLGSEDDPYLWADVWRHPPEHPQAPARPAAESRVESPVEQPPAAAVEAPPEAAVPPWEPAAEPYDEASEPVEPAGGAIVEAPPEAVVPRPEPLEESEDEAPEPSAKADEPPSYVREQLERPHQRTYAAAFTPLPTAVATELEAPEWMRPDADVLMGGNETPGKFAEFRRRHTWWPFLAAGLALVLLFATLGVLTVLGGHVSPVKVLPPPPTSPPTTQAPARTATTQPKPKPKHTAPPVSRHRPAKAKTPPKAHSSGTKSKSSGGLSSGSHAPTMLLTTAAVQSAFVTTWPSFVSAANSGSEGALQQVATPGVVDVALADHLSGTSWPASYSSATMTSPVETSYPLSFLADIGGADLAVFVQDSSSSPWQVAWVAPYSGSAISGAALGHNPAASAGGSLGDAIGQLAGLFQSLRSTGQAPGGNLWDGQINTPGTQLMATAQQLLADHSASVADQRHDAVTYSVNSDSFAFVTHLGSTECSQIGAETVETPTKGGVLVQPPDRSSYGPTLAPGNYSSITAWATRDVCVSVSSAGAFSLSGLTGGLYNVTGVRS